MIRKIKPPRFSVGNLVKRSYANLPRLVVKVTNPISPNGAWAFQGIVVESLSPEIRPVGQFCAHWNRSAFAPVD